MSAGLAVSTEDDLVERIGIELDRVRAAPDHAAVDHLESFHARSWAYWSQVDADCVQTRLSAAVLDEIAASRRSAR